MSARHLFAAALACTLSAASPFEPRYNWSDNIEFTTRLPLVVPDTADELADAVRDAPGRVRVVGTAHSFNDIADTDGLQISLAKMDAITVEKSKRRVTFGAGVNFSRLIKALKAE